MALAGAQDVILTEENLAKAEWGLKRTCQGCAARFYDLARDPIKCPKCGATFDPLAVTKPRRSRAAAAAAAAAKAAPVEAPVAAVEAPTGEDADLKEAAAVADNADDDDNENPIEDASELGENDDVAEVIEGVETPKPEEG